MFSFRRHSVRRRELRRGNRLDDRSRQPRPVLWAALWVCLFAAIAGPIALTGQEQDRYQVGQRVDHTVVSRVAFTAIDQEKTIELKRNDRQREPAVYNANLAHITKLRDMLLSLGRLAMDDKIENIDQIPRETRDSLFLQLTIRFDELRKHVRLSKNWDQQVEQFLASLSALPVLRSSRATIERSREDQASRIAMRSADGTTELIGYDEDLIDVQADRKVYESRLEGMLASKMPQAVARTVIDIVLSDPQPLYVVDEPETERRRKAREDAVEAVKVVREANQVLVKAGTKLAPMDLVLLEQEQAEYEAQLGPGRRWLIRMGGFGLMMMLGSGLWLYIGAYNPRILRNPLRGAALLGLLLLCQGLAVGFTLEAPHASYATTAFPTLLATMILAIVYDRRFALAVGSMLMLVIMLSLRLPVGYAMVLLTGVALAGGQLDTVKNRTTVVIAGVFTGLGMATATWFTGFTGLSLQTIDPVSAVFRDSMYVLVAAVVTGLVVQGFLPFIETAFRVTTAMTLRDLNDVSHPLLRRLAEEAPGTYQHSLRLADMAEAAAETIGVSGLLCRVGAMYHDIGKVNKPQYFIENQGGGPNKHDKLNPAMSLLIIVGHVKDGVEMARDAKLPRAIIHFVESHHGTTLVEYFYHAARRKSEDEDAPMPAEFDFRYPGPKPQTKEAAIVMVCDSVEGACRTLDEPTHGRIEALVHKILHKRLMDGQFDECQITLQELHKVEQAVVRTLTAIYHGRIAYPKDEVEGDGDATQPRAATGG